MTLPPVVSSVAYQAARALLADLKLRLDEALRDVDPPGQLFWEQFNRDVVSVRRLLGGDE